MLFWVLSTQICSVCENSHTVGTLLSINNTIVGLKSSKISGSILIDTYLYIHMCVCMQISVYPTPSSSMYIWENLALAFSVCSIGFSAGGWAEGGMDYGVVPPLTLIGDPEGEGLPGDAPAAETNSSTGSGLSPSQSPQGGKWRWAGSQAPQGGPAYP